MLSAMGAAAAAPDHQARLDGEVLVVGSAQEGDESVHVAEYLSNLRRAARARALWPLAAAACVMLLAAAAVNLILLRLVTRPVGCLAGTVREIAAGRLGAQADCPDTAELATLADAINAMSRSLAEAEIERNAQMAKARRVQAHLLPDVSAVRGFRVASVYQPADNVAGDYFDVSQRQGGPLLFCIADVSGHGIAAALEAAVLKALFLEAADTDAAPGQVLEHVNGKFLAASLPGDFATMLVGRWDHELGRLDYASAGHDPAYLIRPTGGPQELGATGLPLGVDARSAWETRSVPAGRGDRLFLLTDGMAETTDPGGTMFGRRHVEALLADGRDVPLADLLLKVDHALHAHRSGRPSADDVTLVAIEAMDG
jgi:serine phosphatase RsbU (regulator of sigma subunit)